jgi:peptidoglycan/LPS O-acetylase OafA/YrhL
VAFPGLLFFTRRVGVVALLASALAFCLCVRIYGASLYPGGTSALTSVKDGVFGRLDDFVVGIALAFLTVRMKPVGRVASVGLVALGLALFGAACFTWNAIVRRELPYGVVAYLWNVIQASAACLIVGLLGDAPRLVRFAFTAWPIQLLGMMCYSIYVWHPMGTLGPLWDESDLPVFLFAVFLLSAMSYRYIEFPKRTVRELFVNFPK